MKIKALKSGKIAHPDPCLAKCTSLTEGKEYDLDDDLWAQFIIDKKWGEEVKEEEKTGKSVDQMTKGELIDYAEEKGIEIDATANKPVVLEAIQKALEQE